MGKFNFWVFNLLMFMAWVSHIVASAMDPGVMKPVNDETDDPKRKLC